MGQKTKKQKKEYQIHRHNTTIQNKTSMIDRDENIAPDGARAGAASPVKNGFALGDAPPPLEPEEEPREAEGSALPLPLG